MIKPQLRTQSKNQLSTSAFFDNRNGQFPSVLWSAAHDEVHIVESPGPDSFRERILIEDFGNLLRKAASILKQIIDVPVESGREELCRDGVLVQREVCAVDNHRADFSLMHPTREQLFHVLSAAFDDNL